ncbi:MAG: hypothetical protein LBE09_00915 [Christensenellaceae bacterium]|nr:hypothetical protein [Christensenellaceae bacterium]
MTLFMNTLKQKKYNKKRIRRLMKMLGVPLLYVANVRALLSASLKLQQKIF